MNYMQDKIWFKVVISIYMLLIISCSSPDVSNVKPIHLDDIHLIVTNEEAAVSFFEKHFGAREMAHPSDRFDLVRFLSLKWQGPTITITPIGPYPDLPVERNQRWLDAKILSPTSEKKNPVYGVKWLALSTLSLDKAHAELTNSGIKIFEEDVVLPTESDARAFSIYGPDGLEIVIVERTDFDFGNAKYAIDHVQFLVKNIKTTQRFFEKVFSAKDFKRKKKSVRLRVADATLVLSEPEALGINSNDVSSRKIDGSIRIGLDHLGFLYSDVQAAVKQAESNKYFSVFPTQRYVYKNKPTVYTFSAFELPENINIEMVQADGRIGPHSYYVDQNNFK